MMMFPDADEGIIRPLPPYTFAYPPPSAVAHHVTPASLSDSAKEAQTGAFLMVSIGGATEPSTEAPSTNLPASDAAKPFARAMAAISVCDARFAMLPSVPISIPNATTAIDKRRGGFGGTPSESTRHFAFGNSQPTLLVAITTEPFASSSTRRYLSLQRDLSDAVAPCGAYKPSTATHSASQSSTVDNKHPTASPSGASASRTVSAGSCDTDADICGFVTLGASVQQQAPGDAEGGITHPPPPSTTSAPGHLVSNDLCSLYAASEALRSTALSTAGTEAEAAEMALRGDEALIASTAHWVLSRGALGHALLAPSAYADPSSAPSAAGGLRALLTLRGPAR